MRASLPVSIAALGLTVLLAPPALEAQNPAQPRPPAAETELVFEREVFQYPEFTRRNPFIPLDTESEGPRFDQLSLIGVMYSADDPASSVAVVSTGGVTFAEDGTMSPVTGDAFYLKVGQRLGNVTVVQILPQQIVVDVEEFGLTDRRTLEIQSRKGGT
jgi:hypothetical protein